MILHLELWESFGHITNDQDGHVSVWHEKKNRRATLHQVIVCVKAQCDLIRTVSQQPDKEGHYSRVAVHEVITKTNAHLRIQ